MVLENSSDATGGDPFNESPPPSDADRFSGQAGPGNYRIDASKLPKPIPIIGPLVGWNSDVFQQVLDARIKSWAEVTKRLPNQEEVDGIAFWVAKQISISSYASPIGIAGGVYRGYSTMATFRFPFWQPNLEKFNPQSFPTPRFSFLGGNRAMVMWHILRFTSYGWMGQKISQVIFGSYGASVAAVGSFGDPRMKALKDASMKRASEKRGGLNVPPRDQQQPGDMRGIAPVDDASPTGGMFSDDNEALSSSGAGDSIGSTNDDPRSRPTTEAWPQQPRPEPAPTSRAEPQEQLFDMFGDTKKEERPSTNSPTPQPQPQRQGSAWDRLRRGETNNGGWDRLRNQAQNPTASNDYAYSREDEARSLTRDQAEREFDARGVSEGKGGNFNSGNQAQRDFDARVERERKGGDFSSGDGDQKRW